jgi:hypothetical protein
LEDFSGGVWGHLQPRKPGPQSGAYPAEEFSLLQFHQRNNFAEHLVIPQLSGRITWFTRVQIHAVQRRSSLDE